MILVDSRKGVKIRIDGKYASGKNTTRSLLIADATTDEVVDLIRKAVIQAAYEKATAMKEAPRG